MSSRQLIALSPDLKRLRDEKYEIQIVSEHLVVKCVPYVKADKTVAYGTLIAPLVRQGEHTGAPRDHTMWFDGEKPYDNNGNPLDHIIANQENRQITPDLTVRYIFSSKSADGSSWANYYALATTYIAILTRYARLIDPNASALTGRADDTDEPESVFHYPDNASSLAGIGEVTKKLEGHVIAIVGLGGTGSYVLDFVAKTPVNEIRLYDGDRFINHNAFRTPGAASLNDVAAIPPLFKVEYFKRKYEILRRGIMAYPQFITTDNVNELLNADFIFLCIDAPSAKKVIIDALSAADKPFIDVGMGITLAGTTLGGQLRTTFSTSQKRTHRNGIPVEEGENEIYDLNIQIVELNALNAAFAVIRWKKHLGFYYARNPEFSSLYTIQFNRICNEDRLENDEASS